MDDALHRCRADKVARQLGRPERARKRGGAVRLAAAAVDDRMARGNLRKWPFRI